MKNEKLERISDLCVSKQSVNAEHKFRVSFKVVARGSAKVSESSFAYLDLLAARRCYRDILLSLYKGRGIGSFAICLNRYRSKPWEKPIYLESANDDQHAHTRINS